MQMDDRGFQIDMKVDWNTGLTLGGNERNCGTWMDKVATGERMPEQRPSLGLREMGLRLK